MGRARSHGYRLDGPCPTPSIANGTPVVPAANRPATATAASSVHRPPGTNGRHGAAWRARERVPRNRRRPKDKGCRNPQVRKGIGSCVFVLGIPCLIAGLILTIVSSTDDGADGRKYPASFPVLGPVLLALSVVCFVAGVLLYNVAILHGAQDCLRLSDKDSFVRRHFPRLSAWLKPDMVTALTRNQAAIDNLRTAPARSALRKIPNPDLVPTEPEPEVVENEGEGEGDHHGHNNRSNGHHFHHHRHHHPHHQPLPRRKRAVTFSHGDEDEEEGVVGVRVGGRLNSTSSEPDRVFVQSETGMVSEGGGGGGGGGGRGSLGQSPSASLLSLRHCKIRPKDDVFWTDSSADQGGGGVFGGESEDGGGGGGVGESEEGGGGGESEDGGGDDGSGGGGSRGHPPALNGVTVPDGGDDGGGVKVSLTDIDEERA